VTDAPAPPRTDEAARSWLPRALRVLRHRDLALVEVGNSVSQLGTWMQYVGFGWAISGLTRWPFAVALSFVAQFSPSLVLAPFAGAIADRFDRRHVVIMGNLAMTAPPVAIGLFIADHSLTIPWLLALATMGGIAQALTYPAQMAVVPRLVPEDEVGQAISLNAGLMSFTRMLGPGAGGLAIGLWGLQSAFYLNGISFLAVVAAWMFVRPEGTRADRAAGSFLVEMRRGLAYARRVPLVRHLLILVAVVSMFVFHGPLMPLFARDVLHGGVTAYSLLSSATGIGAIFGAFIAGEIVTDRMRRTAIAAGGLGSAAALLMFSVSRSLALSVVCLAGFGLSYFAMHASVTTVLMLAVPDDYRGRIMGLFGMFATGGVPIAAILGGLVGSWLGPPTAVAIGGSAIGAYAVWFVASGALRLVRTETPRREVHTPTPRAADIA